MTLFLTSAPGGYYTGPARDSFVGLDERNGFVERLRERWKRDSRILFISASPGEAERNDEARPAFQRAFAEQGLSAREIRVCDDRDPACDLDRYDMVILGGGHVPTQNAFFHRIGLRSALAGFDGIVLGISAGTMNCAETVYAQPELPGEALDPDYRRFLPGLGLTDIMVLPHYQMLRDETLDGLRIIEDITMADSMGRRFYVLVDGSYILAEQGEACLYGESYLAENGKLRPLCENGRSLRL